MCMSVYFYARAHMFYARTYSILVSICFYTCVSIFLCLKKFICSCMYVSMIVPVWFYALTYSIHIFLYSCPYVSMLLLVCVYAHSPIFLCSCPYIFMLGKFWIKKFWKYIHNGTQIVHKKVTNLMVKTVCEFDIWVKNYSENTKRKKVSLHACVRWETWGLKAC